MHRIILLPPFLKACRKNGTKLPAFYRTVFPGCRIGREQQDCPSTGFPGSPVFKVASDSTGLKVDRIKDSHRHFFKTLRKNGCGYDVNPMVNCVDPVSVCGTSLT